MATSSLSETFGVAAIQALKESRWQDVVQLTEMALREDSDADYWYMRGIAFYHMKIHSESVSAFTQAVNKLHELEWFSDPKSIANLFGLRGLEFFQLKKFKAASQDFSAAIALDPSEASLYSHRGNSFYQMEMFEDAVRDHTVSISMQPKTADFYDCRGKAMVGLQRSEDAHLDFSTAISLEPNNPNYFFDRSAVLIRMERFSEALTDCETAIHLNPGTSRFYLARIAALMRLQRWNEATEDFLRFKDLGGNAFSSEVLDRKSFASVFGLCENIESILEGVTDEGMSLSHIGPILRNLQELVCYLVLGALEINSPDTMRQILGVCDLLKNAGQTIRLRSLRGKEFRPMHSFQLPPSTGIAYFLVENYPGCDDRLVRWVWSDSEVVHCDWKSVEVLRLHDAVEEMELIVQEFSSPDSMSSSELLISSRSRQRATCEYLYDLTIRGLENHLEGASSIQFVPHECLFRLSFGSLLDRVAGKYFIEMHGYSVFPSISSIFERSCREESGPTRTSGVVFSYGSDSKIGDQKKSEVVDFVRSIGTVCPVVVVTGTEFTRDNVLRFWEDLRPKYVHFQTHSHWTGLHEEDQTQCEMLDEYQISGRLVCADSSILYASEISYFDLHGTDFVFLNSCGSGLGNITVEGVLGFSRSLFEAGTRSILCTQWTVLDSISTVVSQEFYHRHITLGQSKAAALRSTVLSLDEIVLGGRRFRFRDFPVLWGAFQLFGHSM